jgi:hypothetical protein
MVEAQYNPSTGEASYDSSTGSQQTVKPPLPSDPCENCPSDPFIPVTISGVTSCCSVNDAGTKSRKFNAAVFSTINNSHIFGDKPVSCSFAGGIELQAHELLEYDTPDCSGTPIVSDLVSVNFFVTLDENGFYSATISGRTTDLRQIEIQRWYQEKTGSGFNCFNEELINELEESCGDPSVLNSGWTTIAENGIWDMT